jgi:hypothetical protein
VRADPVIPQASRHRRAHRDHHRRGCEYQVYWVLYWWVPAGVGREMLTDAPVLISWLAVFVISLPRAIEMWTEPAEVREPISTANAVSIYKERRLQ